MNMSMQALVMLTHDYVHAEHTYACVRMRAFTHTHTCAHTYTHAFAHTHLSLIHI